jgi:hypothetical protein
MKVLRSHFTSKFEQENFAYTDAGRAVVEALADEFATRWYPKVDEAARQKRLLRFV